MLNKGLYMELRYPACLLYTSPGGHTDLDGKADPLPATGTNLYGLLLLAILLVGGGTLLLRRHLIVR